MPIESSEGESYLPYAALFAEIRDYIEEYHKEKFGDDPLYPIVAYVVWTKIEEVIKWYWKYRTEMGLELDKFLLSIERPDYPWEGPFQL